MGVPGDWLYAAGAKPACLSASGFRATAAFIVLMVQGDYPHNHKLPVLV